MTKLGKENYQGSGMFLRLSLSGLGALLVYFWTADFPFFWDSIQLASRQATHFYDGGGLLLPNAIDSGHPPGFGLYLAIWWQLPGRQLWVSHLAMVPWVWMVFLPTF
ncbi:MAG: hypothetical protein HC821_02075 [Lewinella sp.]|nr:hypothetical protein [Lewinella sp.]